jgi:hypothetical protein
MSQWKEKRTKTQDEEKRGSVSDSTANDHMTKILSQQNALIPTWANILTIPNLDQQKDV